MEQLKNLNNLSLLIQKRNAEKGFWDFERNVGEMLMLIVSELGEAMEAHRKVRFSNKENFEILESLSGKEKIEYFKNNFKDTFEDEIADAMIRLFDLCGGLGIDIENQIQAKLEYNQSRERLHGKNY